MAYVITKKAEGVFEIVKDSEVYISDSKWSGTQKDGFFDFKSENGARLYSNVYFNQVQFIDETETGTVETFASAIALHIRLKQEGFFDTSGGSGSGGVTTFKELTDTFSSFAGHNGKAVTISGNSLVPTFFYNKQYISELNDVSSSQVQDLDNGTILQVQTVTDGVNTFKRWVAVPFPSESGMLSDGFLSFGSLTRNVNEIDISIGYTWRLNGNEYGNLVDYNFVIESAATGDSRVDIIVANPDNTFEIIQGQPSAGTGTAIAEATPIGSLFLTSIDIYEDNISDPENPFIGELYVEKKEYGSFNVFDSGDLGTIVLNGIHSRFDLIGDIANGVTSIGSMSRNGTNYKEYPGKTLYISNFNQTEEDCGIINDDVTADSVLIPFKIPGLATGEMLVIPFGFTAVFYYGNGYFNYNKFIGSGAGSGVQSVTGSMVDNTDPLNPVVLSDATKADLVGGKVPQSQLPSYVDDVVEGYLLSNVFYVESSHTTVIPAEVGKIYIDLTTGQKNRQYRWSGSTYIQITNGLIASTNDVPEGSNNLYFTAIRVLATLLTGIIDINGAITASDSILVAFGKIKKFMGGLVQDFSAPSADTFPSTLAVFNMNRKRSFALIGPDFQGSGSSTNNFMYKFSLPSFTFNSDSMTQDHSALGSIVAGGFQLIVPYKCKISQIYMYSNITPGSGFQTAISIWGRDSAGLNPVEYLYGTKAVAQNFSIADVSVNVNIPAGTQLKVFIKNGSAAGLNGGYLNIFFEEVD